MRALYCDVCKKTIEDPVSNRNYWHIGPREICEPCKDTLETSLRPTIRTKDPFDYEWFDKMVVESLEKAIQKGKF